MGPATPSRLALNEASWSGTARSARYKWTSEPAARDRPGFPPLARTTSTQIPLARLPHTSGPASLQLATGPAFPRLPEPPPHKYRLPDCLIRVELRPAQKHPVRSTYVENQMSMQANLFAP